MIPDVYLQNVLEIWSDRGEKTVSRIVGNSMSPLLRDGDCLTIEHGCRGMRVGDVAVFGTPTRLRAHFVVGRIVEGNKELFLLKGNQCASFDEPVPKDQIFGKVIEAKGSNGYIRFEARYWRAVSRFLAIRSYIQGKCHAPDSAFWKSVRFLSRFRPKLPPSRWALKSRLWGGVCLTSRILCPTRSRGLENPGGAKP